MLDSEDINLEQIGCSLNVTRCPSHDVPLWPPRKTGQPPYGCIGDHFGKLSLRPRYAVQRTTGPRSRPHAINCRGSKLTIEALVATFDSLGVPYPATWIAKTASAILDVSLGNQEPGNSLLLSIVHDVDISNSERVARAASEVATDAAIADPVAPPRMLVLQCHGVDAEGKFLKSMGINLHKRDDFDHVGWFDTHRAIVDLHQPQEEDIWKNDNFFFSTSSVTRHISNELDSYAARTGSTIPTTTPMPPIVTQDSDGERKRLQRWIPDPPPAR